MGWAGTIDGESRAITRGDQSTAQIPVKFDGKWHCGWPYNAENRGGVICLNDTQPPRHILACLPCLSRSRRVRSDVVRGTPDAPSDPPATARVARLGQSRLFQQGIVGTFADVDDDLVCPGLDDSRGVDELPEQC